MKKADTLKHWRELTPNLPILPHFRPIPYGAQGSTYGACGIRIDGSPAFIDAVLSRLQDVIAGENHVTRLALARSVVDGSGIGKVTPNQVSNAEVCYIRLHCRSDLGSAVSAFFDKDLNAATEQYAGSIGA